MWWSLVIILTVIVAFMGIAICAVIRWIGCEVKMNLDRERK